VKSNVIPLRPKALPPAHVAVPETLRPELDALVARVAEALGQTPERTRRAVEIAVLQRGLAELGREYGAR